MAIVINGSGTVTGISVGGLPDGIVDAGTLATNSVDSAELIDGAIDTAHIATDQITRAILPAGTILQVVTSEWSTDTSTTSTSSISTGHTVSITPTASNSKMLIMLSGSGGHHGADGGWLKLDMHRSSAGGSAYIGSGEKFRASTTGGTSLVTYCWNVIDTVPSADAITYTMYYRSQHVSNTTYYRWSDKGNPLLTVMEIAV